MKAIMDTPSNTNILLAGLNPFLGRIHLMTEKLLVAQILIDPKATIGKIVLCHCVISSSLRVKRRFMIEVLITHTSAY